MKIEKVKGVVINDTNYSESSKVLHVLTNEYGKIGVLSKGCRNLKSPLRVVSSKLSYGYFNIYYKEDGLSTLINADLIDEFTNIKKDLTKIGYAFYLLNLSDQVYKESEGNQVFDILEASLIKINNGFDPMIITNIAELKYLNFLGVKPILDKCAICGSDKDIVTINSDFGGYICNNCYNNQYIVDEKTVKLLRMFDFVDINKIKELNILDKNKLEIDKFLSGYYEKWTGLYLKSKDFLKQIK